MKLIIFYFIIYFNFFILTLTHPMMITLFMIIQTLLMSMMVGFMSQSFWLTYIMFLVFIGGLLILFIYISSLMPNKIFLFSKIKILMMKFFYLIMFIFLTNLSFNFSNLEMNNWLDKNNFFLYNNTENSYFISNLFNNNEMYLTIAMMLYLIMALIITTKISNSFYGPMRIKF